MKYTKVVYNVDSTCPLVLAVGWWITGLISSWERKIYFLSWTNSQNEMVLGCRFEWKWWRICSALQAVISFSGWDKSRDSTAKSLETFRPPKMALKIDQGVQWQGFFDLQSLINITKGFVNSFGKCYDNKKFYFY